jgi:hypothetical protein
MNFSMRSAELSILCLKIQYKSQGKRMLADNAQAIHNVTYMDQLVGALVSYSRKVLILSVMHRRYLGHLNTLTVLF